LFYYNDSKQCQSLKKLLEKCSLVPQELRNEANDGMTLDQAKLLFPEVDQLLVVRRGAEKSFIETHPITENLDDATLTRLIINPETGTVKAPTILAGRSLVVGFEKDTEEYFSCYLFWRVPK
jgi:arsenate reductase-like glutaredoxin family protein